MAEEDASLTMTTPLSMSIPCQNTKLRNLSLITSWKNAFIYILNPALAGLFFWISIWTYMNYTRHLVAEPKIIFGIHVLTAVAYIFTAMIMAIERAQDIRDKLHQAGYVQIPSRSAQLDLGLNIAILGAFLWQLLRQKDLDDDSSIFLRFFYAPTLFVTFWLLVCLTSLGSTIWFTVRVR